MQVLGVEPWSFGRATSVLNWWAISLAPLLLFLSPGWPQTYKSPVLVSQVPGWQACIAMPGFGCAFDCAFDSIGFCQVSQKPQPNLTMPRTACKSPFSHRLGLRQAKAETDHWGCVCVAGMTVGALPCNLKCFLVMNHWARLPIKLFKWEAIMQTAMITQSVRDYDLIPSPTKLTFL